MEHIERSVLDNPTWFALTTRQTRLARGTGLARRYEPAVAPFAAVSHAAPEAYRELKSLLAPGESVLLQTLLDEPSIEGDRLFAALQMVDRASPATVDDQGVIRLQADDADEMLAVAKKTNPGPFASRTIETGRYIGIREEGRLIAMAGERMCMDGYVEISAVCVDDTHRGKGLAGRLMNILRYEINRRGDTPFLHVRDDNASAIALYHRLGFESRQTFALYRIGRA
jgi:ribosomal protein S18 acetylase RimI-like enzyme